MVRQAGRGRHEQREEQPEARDWSSASPSQLHLTRRVNCRDIAADGPETGRTAEGRASGAALLLLAHRLEALDTHTLPYPNSASS